MKSTTHIKRVYYTILFLFWLATALPLALSVLILQTRNLNLLQVSLLMGIYSLTIVLLELPTGGLADAIGRKKVTFLSYSISGLTSLIFLFSFSFPLFLLAFILMGVARALMSGALDAWFIDALQTADPDIDLQPAFAKAGTVTLLALGMGTLLGGFIPRWFAWLPAEGTAVLTPFTMTIVFALGVNIILLGVLATAVKEDRPTATAKDWRSNVRQVPQNIRDAVQMSRQNSTIMLLLGAGFATGLGILSLETFWQPFFADLLGGGETQSLFFGTVMAGYFLVGVVGNVLATPLSKLLHQQYALVAALFQGLQGVLLMVLAGQTAVAPAIILYWLVFMGMSVVSSPHAALINNEIPSERRSSMLSVQSLATYAGAILGSVALGYVAENSSIRMAWTVAGSVLLVSLLLYLRIYTEKRHEQQTAILPHN
jgi:MFS family permease